MKTKTLLSEKEILEILREHFEKNGRNNVETELSVRSGLNSVATQIAGHEVYNKPVVIGKVWHD